MSQIAWSSSAVNKEKVMRVHYVKKARAAKKPRRCSCGHEVQAGEPYKWAEPRFGPILIWCQNHSPKRSELTSSKMGAVYDAQDDVDLSGTGEEMQDALNSIAEVTREVAAEYEESIEAMPEGLQEGPVAEDMRERIDALENYADELEEWEAVNEDAEEFDEDEVGKELIKEMFDDVDSEDDLDDDQRVDWEDALKEKRDEFDAEHGEEELDALREQAQEVVDNFDY